MNVNSVLLGSGALGPGGGVSLSSSPFLFPLFSSFSDGFEGFTFSGSICGMDSSVSRLEYLPNVLRPLEVRRLLSVCNPVEYVILEFYLRTGVRAFEGLRVRVKDIDFVEDFVFIHRGKRIKDRIVPFDSHLKEILQGYITQWGLGLEDYLFCVQKIGGSSIKNNRYYKKTSSSYSRSSLYDMVNLLAVKAGLQSVEYPPAGSGRKMVRLRVHPHLLRHTALTMVQESCGDPFITKEIAGHSSLKSTEIYVHLAVDRKRAAMEEAFKILDKPAS